jgi:hypothetical protein
MENKETEKQAVPVMRQLARPMSQEELASVAGAGCSYHQDTGQSGHDEPDYLN